MLDHLQQAGIAAKKALAEVGAALDEEFLILAVRDLTQAPHQQAVAVILNETVPISAPDHLDHVPPGAAEDSLQLLDDLAVAPDWTIQPLEIAVHDKDEIVEPLTRGEGNRT